MEGKPRIRRLVRSRDERVLAGVCGGLGEYFNVDPVLFRIGFAIAAVFGIGVVTYLAIYVFVPSQGENGEPRHSDDSARLIAAVFGAFVLMTMSGGFLPFTGSDVGPFWGIIWLLFWIATLGAVVYGAVLVWRRMRDRESGAGPSQPTEWTVFRVLALIALIIAMLTLASILAVFAAWIGATVNGWLVAATAAVALALFVGGLLSRRSRWLLVPALALAIPLAAVEASGIEIHGGYGDRHVTPPSVAAIPDDGYELAAGDLLVNLERIRWRRKTVVDLRATMGIGRVSVVVPERVCVTSDTSAKVGAISVRGDSEAGIAVEKMIETAPDAGPTLRIDASVQAGLIQVVTRPPDDWANETEDWRHEDERPQRPACFDGR